MRYFKTEDTVLVGYLVPNSNVTITIIDLDNDKVIPLTDNNCVESEHIEGLYAFSTSNIDKDKLEDRIYNLFYIMEDDVGNKTYGKFTLGTKEEVLLEDIKDTVIVTKDTVEIIKNIEAGTWIMEDGELKFFDELDNLIAKFELRDIYGNKTMRNYVKRIRVE